MTRLRRRLGGLRLGLGLLLAVIALSGRFATGPVDARAVGEWAAVLEATVPCEGMPAAPADRSRPHRSDHLLLTLADAASQPAPTLLPTPVVPAPRRMADVRPEPGPATAIAPAVHHGAALPRGPPILA